MTKTQTDSVKRPAIAIVGGGFSGAGVAFHLARTMHEMARLIVFEPRRELGRGLAYDTDDPSHRINVPAARMSLLPDEPEDFLDWIADTDGVADDPEALWPNGNLYPQRRLFGAYVAARLRPYLENGRIEHRRTRVKRVLPDPKAWMITDSDGEEMRADLLVIATSHPAPSAPPSLCAALAGHPRFFADPTRPGSLDAIRPDDRVLIVGNGLTSADIIASLTRSGHQGPITSISRRGLRSRGHPPCPQEPLGDFLSEPATSAAALLRNVRNSIAQAAELGESWHAVIDQVRSNGHEIWRNLPLAERQRIVRHLRPYWDVHRFRIAPQVEEVLDRAIADGRLEILAACVAGAKIDGAAIDVFLLRRSGERVEKRFDAVVVTTGPAHGGILQSQMWLHELAQSGHLTLDPTGLGIACNESSEAVGTDGVADSSLLISGPLARGTFGELMGLPQVSEHAVFIAAELAKKLKAVR
ncbi:FAD-NAD(P)-binding domain-containing protein (plasmid) [Rhizobium etli 8C-3]|uniref:FAD-NAD(P)-binding domain-containing protein n=1 Tax=Rhizobium etli 8C-3 TaxID=538025 RepID=A0A1L5PF61_RHIET|nr:FAD/NAD(P)-binding protein [Rhizobium etli]APO78606.1 FAD-NAD(P)-binding domain-containing protein [Rhizobium etli 8C-3]